MTTRRRALGGVASVVGFSAGCLQRARSVITRQSGSQISLSIKTVPADEDRAVVEIARHLANHLNAVGIDTEIELLREDVLRRDVLVNHAFDIYVDRYPGHHDPDFLRPVLHSAFNGEPGWQNPFGFNDLTLDELLVEQRRREGAARRSVVFDIQRGFARQQPFTVIGFPDEIRTARSDRFEGWTEMPLRDPLSFVQITPVDTTGQDREADTTALRVTITDDRVTKNFNPIAVEFRNQGTFMGLIYDPLARRVGGAVRPWLARDWAWEVDGSRTVATVHLRDDLRWHDSNPLTAADVAFTFRFLADTSLGDRENPVPAPRFRGRVSLVDTVDAIDDRTLRFEFVESSTEVAARALTVPVLPIHEWEPKATEVNLVGLDLFDGITEALVWENPSPVGSGVFRFQRSIPEEVLILERYEDHFLERSNDGDVDPRFDDGVSFDELIVRVAPSDSAAVELVAAGEVDAMASSGGSSIVPRIGRTDDLQLLVDRSRSFYHVGYNTRRGPLSNQRFRRAVAGLLDKGTIATEIYGGYLTPAAAPIAGSEWTPSDLRWTGTDPEVPFMGSPGELDTAAARTAFRDAGYRYDENGRLLTR